MTFPTPHAVTVHPYIAGAQNAHGVPAPTFGADVVEPVIAIYPPSDSDEPFESGRSALVVDLEILVPSTFVHDRRSEITVTAAPYAGRYAIEGGVSDFNLGPFGFKPGGRLGLKLVKELGDA